MEPISDHFILISMFENTPIPVTFGRLIEMLNVGKFVGWMIIHANQVHGVITALRPKYAP